MGMLLKVHGLKFSRTSAGRFVGIALDRSGHFCLASRPAAQRFLAQLSASQVARHCCLTGCFSALLLSYRHLRLDRGHVALSTPRLISRWNVNETKILQMADTIRTLMGMTEKPEQIADELLGIMARTREWTPEELAELRKRVLPPSTNQ